MCPDGVLKSVFMVMRWCVPTAEDLRDGSGQAFSQSPFVLFDISVFIRQLRKLFEYYFCVTSLNLDR